MLTLSHEFWKKSIRSSDSAEILYHHYLPIAFDIRRFKP
jgi:hypothetical protein